MLRAHHGAGRHGRASGGWRPFGPERLITRADGNVLFELDHKPALEVYKRYLGPCAEGLPSTGLLFPLSIRSSASPGRLVRMHNQSMTVTAFAEV